MPIIGTIASSYRAAPTATAAYESIASITITSGVTSLTFTSIPTTYKQLQIRARLIPSDNNPYNWRMRWGNGSVDTGANYQFSGFAGDAGGTTTYTTTNSVFARFIGFSQGTASTNQPYSQVMDIVDYASTDKIKMSIGIGGGDAAGTAGSGEAAMVVNYWNSTSAIDTIAIYPYYGVTAKNFGVGSIVSIYGLKS